MVTVFTDEELEHMLTDLESDRVERKESFHSAADRVREAVCAMANDLPDYRGAGVIFIGAKDDGAPSGLAITDQLLLNLAEIKTDGNILPPPTLTVTKRVLRGAEIAVIIVEPSDSPPVRFRGRIHIRVGPRRAIATAQDERILSKKRRYRDRPYDIHPLPSATIEDFDRLLFEEVYLPSAFAPDVLAANDRDYLQRLAATKMIVSVDDPTPTVLGILILSPRTRDFLPGAYIQFLRIVGTTLADTITDAQLVDGPISHVMHSIDEKFKSHNRTGVDLVSASVEQRRQPYPLPALQQLVRNAVLHRTYEATNTPVRVTWYDDRIDILSPGGPFGTVSIENFGRPGVTDYRNPNLAEALRVLGFVQHFGVGIPIAQQALARNGNPPLTFDVAPHHVSVSVRPAP